LHTLRLDGIRDVEIPQHFVEGVPSLKSIFLRDVKLPRRLISLTAITTLYLNQTHDIFGPVKFSAVLNGLPALIHLTVSGSWSSVGEIKLPSLHSLQMRADNDTHQIRDLLRAISAPLLHSLLIDELVAGEIYWLHAPSPKYPSPHSLTVLADKSLPVTSWRRLMRVFPTVKHFTLSSDAVDNFLLSFDERADPADTAHWPNLHTLTLVDRPGYVKPTMLRTALSARITSACPIRKLQLSKSILDTLDDGDYLEQLRALVEVEEDKLYPDLQEDTYVVEWADNWPEDD